MSKRSNSPNDGPLSPTTSRPVVIFGFLGSKLDRAEGDRRWDSWRPTVSLGMFDDLEVHRIELIVPRIRAPWIDQALADLHATSPETEVRCHSLDVKDQWDFDRMFAALHDLALKLDVQPEQEDLLVHITTGTHVAQICMFLLTEAGFLPGRLLQLAPPRRRQRGGRQQRVADPGSWNVIDLDLSRYDQIATRFHQDQLEARDFLKSGIKTRNTAFNQLIDRIEQVAANSKDPILLAGPTGAGKSRLAERIFELRQARGAVNGSFIEINCATLRGDSAMSALFGHRAGAFTGAVKNREGLLRAADDGVLFLDEIGELGLDEQAMLLRAIETKRFLPVGSDKEVKSDFQLIAGSNLDLHAACREGAFRDDLLARIDLWTFSMPGLAERREDIEPNLDYELNRLQQEAGQRLTFNTEARQRFLQFACSPDASWTRNFRDLNASVTRMVTLAPAGRVGLQQVTEEVERLEQAWGSGTDLPAIQPDLVTQHLGEIRAQSLDRFERVQLEDVLSVCSGSRSLSQAGRVLFSESLKRRKSSNDADRLRKYLARYDLQGTDVLS